MNGILKRKKNGDYAKQMVKYHACGCKTQKEQA
jgi:hypothetical protein